MVLTGLALLLGLNAVTNFTEKARGGVGLVLIIGFSLFTLGLFTWISDNSYLSSTSIKANGNTLLFDKYNL